eukprot:1159086-Pelagomonas_calceolata.AAC.2
MHAPQQKWDETSDSEKPAAIAIVIAVIVAQVAIGASVEAVERIPLLSPFLEFVGFAVTSVYAYRYATDPAESEAAVTSERCACSDVAVPFGRSAALMLQWHCGALYEVPVQ